MCVCVCLHCAVYADLWCADLCVCVSVWMDSTNELCRCSRERQGERERESEGEGERERGETREGLVCVCV